MTAEEKTRPLNIARTEDSGSVFGQTSVCEPEEAVDGLVAGSVVGGYVLEAIRGRGGFATVYRARQQSSDTVVAIKVLHPHLTAAESGPLRRFEREIETITRLRHPGIVKVTDSGEVSPGRPFYVMEWLEGASLDEQLKSSGPFSTAEALALVDELGSALVAAHALGIIHRDIKASNVMLVTSGTSQVVKLLDFGIAKLLDADAPASQGLTSTGAQIGTPYYMAPEQICGLAIDARTDVYALGILLFELLTGRLPFMASTAVAIAEMHLYAPPPRARDIAPVAPAIDQVIQRCLQKRATDRFESVDELRVALRDAASSSTALQARTTPAFVARVEIEIADDDEAFDDAVLDDLQDVIEIAKRELAVQFEDVTVNGNLVVGVARLPHTAPESARARTALLNHTLLSSRRIAERPGKHRLMTTMVSVCLGTISEGRAEYASGIPLIRHDDRVFVTQEVLGGLHAFEGTSAEINGVLSISLS